MTELNKHQWDAIEPLLHSITASLAIQQWLYWKAREAVLVYYRVNDEAKTHKNSKTKL